MHRRCTRVAGDVGQQPIEHCNYAPGRFHSMGEEGKDVVEQGPSRGQGPKQPRRLLLRFQRPLRSNLATSEFACKLLGRVHCARTEKPLSCSALSAISRGCRWRSRSRPPEPLDSRPWSKRLQHEMKARKDWLLRFAPLHCCSQQLQKGTRRGTLQRPAARRQTGTIPLTSSTDTPTCSGPRSTCLECLLHHFEGFSLKKAAWTENKLRPRRHRLRPPAPASAVVSQSQETRLPWLIQLLTVVPALLQPCLRRERL